MKVRDLITALAEMPLDAEVIVSLDADTFECPPDSKDTTAYRKVGLVRGLSNWLYPYGVVIL